MVLPIKDSVANLFYGKIFCLDPGLQTLFRGDMKVQTRKLMVLRLYRLGTGFGRSV